MSRRLKDMQGSGLIARHHDVTTGQVNYIPTDMARKLEPIVHALGQWAHENIDSAVTLQKLDSRLLMWNVRRKIDLRRFPDRRSVVQFIFPEQKPEHRNYWLIARPGCEVDLCVTDPGFEVDLFVESELKTLTRIYMGFAPMSESIKRGEMYVVR
ncbi:winged helix-turn-helix transcriptional regulator [Asticcacaulis sp. SL142]|uniref:winged helix-turn-helix transcriptional regulator n=1 Tax=Asticcacaulis sp. SL142 TaxID=2995155 RepID=UPI00226CDBCB|nr:winged helix-turn-helix transcriptional regulator [Asticcacaulis sp. SL142]WAC47965.1 winged helix-turn-helix transcriptional regulator [Asticcacaulis sp. SL142]